MDGCIKSVIISAYVQENGIIRDPTTGLLIGRLDDEVTFDKLVKLQGIDGEEESK